MNWRVLRIVTISLWGILLLVLGNLELANAPTNPCYHCIDIAYDCSIYYQFYNPFCLCPGQQAITCSASSTRIQKTTTGHGKYHSPLDGHCYKDSEARDQQEGGNQCPLPSQLSRKYPETSMPLFPNNWACHLLREECQILRIGKRSPKWQWLKDKEREKSP